MLVPIHVAAGGLAMVLGATALLAKKGGAIHRKLLFVYAMVVLGISAAMLGNVLGGFMTVYFVGTALTTVRPVSAWTRMFNVAALMMVVGLALLMIVGGVQAFNSPRGFLNGVPFVMFFFIAVSWRRLAACASCDSACLVAGRTWRAICGGCALRCSSRPDRSSRSVSAWQKSFPSHSRPAPMRALPLLLVFGAMFYWLWRVRGRRTLPVLVRHDSMPLGSRAN